MFKFFQTIKMTWMFYWRLAIFAPIIFHQISWNSKYIFITSLVLAIILAATDNIIMTFPIFRLIFRREVLHDSKNIPKKTPAPTQPYQQYTPKPFTIPMGAPHLQEAYKSSNLSKVSLPNTSSMQGIPGFGLDESDFNIKAIELGKKGEEHFAKALNITNISGRIVKENSEYSLINKIETLWSVAMPSEKGIYPDKDFDTDIDCIMVLQGEIYLIDLKLYSGGEGTKYRQISNNTFTITSKNGAVTNREMSRNMEMAADRFSKIMPGRRIHTFVVFVPPGNQPEAEFETSILWPGVYNPAMHLSSFINYISHKTSSYSDKALAHSMKSLIKR